MRGEKRGFTLAELMFVVVILGVLTMLAVNAFHRPLVSTRGLEPGHFLLSVRASQENYLSQHGEYLGDLQPDAWPAQVPVGEKANWGIPDNDWYSVERPPRSTWFRYTMVAGHAGEDAPAGAPPGLDTSRPWFWAYAEGDADGDGRYSLFEITSQRDSVYSEDDTE